MNPGAAVRLIAAVTWRRMLRGRALPIGIVIALLPTMFAVAIRGFGVEPGGGEVMFSFELLVTAVLGAMLVGSSIGEDIEDRTSTYLWSRPVARWCLPA